MATRDYKGTDAQMLLASNFICDRCIENVTLLSAKRPLWKESFFQDLKIKINKAFDENIGVDILPQIKESTATLNKVIGTVHRGLMELKQEVEVDFRKNPIRKETILSSLGLNKLKAKSTTQTGYIEILFTIKSNLSDDIKEEMVGNGANPNAIESLLAQANIFVSAYNVQESLKVNRKSTNAVNVEALNEIYDEVISICKLASTYLAGNKELQEQFNFTNALKVNGYSATPRKVEPAKNLTND